MTERGLPAVGSAPACPFVAFEDDRDTRSTSPDHRHRCYAEPVPAPRAAAHQEAYCLSSAFPVCPTFQDWARREAAHARGEGERPAAAPSATARSGVAATSGAAATPEAASRSTARNRDRGGHRNRRRARIVVGRGVGVGAAFSSPMDLDTDGHDDGEPERPPRPHVPIEEPPIRRNPPRDWAAPPPWASGATGGLGGVRRAALG